MKTVKLSKNYYEKLYTWKKTDEISQKKIFFKQN